MVVNGLTLARMAPIRDMLLTKGESNGVSFGLGEAGYDIRLKQDVTFLRGINPRIQITGEDYADYMGGYKEDLGSFCLASAIEEFDMPSNLVGIVHDKSTWARQGLSVFNTVIEPGWRGFLTLELVYHGNGDLHIPAGSGIAQVVFHQTAESAAYKGKYQHQADEPVAAITDWQQKQKEFLYG